MQTIQGSLCERSSPRGQKLLTLGEDVIYGAHGLLAALTSHLPQRQSQQSDGIDITLNPLT
jgi:hypothetical protein